MKKCNKLSKCFFFWKSSGFSLISWIQSAMHRFYESVNWRHGDRKNPKFLVIQEGGIGDYIISIPFLLSLKKHYNSGCHITVLVRSICVPFAKVEECVDDIFIYDSPKHVIKKKTGGKSFPFLELAGRRFDCVIWLQGDLRAFGWVLRHWIPMKSIAKFPNPLRWSWLAIIKQKKLINKKFGHVNDSMNRLGQEVTGGEFIPVSGQEVSRAFSEDSRIPILSKRKDFKIVYIHVSAGDSLRLWPEERFCLLANLLLALKENIYIYLVGAGDDFERAERIRRGADSTNSLGRVENSCGKVSLRELAGMLRGGSLFIGLDSGPMHLAALCGIPIVALFGPQSQALFGPRGKQLIKVISKDYFCSPCWQFACLHTASDPGKCIMDISALEVFEKARSILQGAN